MTDDYHLRKNENDYWLCPLCGHALIYDSTPDKPYCPKFVDILKPTPTTGTGLRWNHYDICPATRPYEGNQYTAVLPPWYIQWYDKAQHLVIRRIERGSTLLIPFLEQDNVSHDDLLKMYKRLVNLKVFA